jgi:dTDP-4-amino-4,6-dideoxygalactose transaminase
MKICGEYDVPVVLDSAEALGARYFTTGPPTYGTEDGKKALPPNSEEPQVQPAQVCPGREVHAGTGAKAAIFSFNGNKILNTSGGGMLVSEDRELIARARFLSQQAKDPAPHYEHSEIGFNYRMSNILAAIGRGQLRVLEERVRRKREIFEWYRQALGGLAGLEFMPEAPYGKSSRWLTAILITPDSFGADREEVRLALEAENIESRPVWKPLHLQPVFRGASVRGGKISEDLFQRGLCLPSGTAMTEEDLERVVRVLRKKAKVKVRSLGVPTIRG